jgi:class 3 adenylate cyclase/tetratricopeptide (TPR) repeat protein
MRLHVPSIETITILISDLVGSTSLASRVGPAAADELRREHFGLLRAAIEEMGGSEVKNTGDGLMVAFRSSSAAIDCAIAMQQRLARRNRHSKEPLHVRIGVGTGDATVENGDYFGMPSVEAARLCDHASSDGILITEPVKLMARRSGDVFTPRGAMNLKGIAEPVSVFEVRWGELERAGVIALPPELRTATGHPLVGRAAELATVSSAWQASSSGRGGVLLISGEPGSGKTRLLVEMAAMAHADGATVLYGRCREDLGTPYQPLLEAVRHYLSVCPRSRLAALSEHRPILVRLAPGLEALLPDRFDPAPRERRSEQRLMTDAMQALLTSAARHAPTMLALDEVQWARPPLLKVLRTLAAAVESNPMMLVLAYRDTEVGTDDPISDLIVDLRRMPGVDRIALTGLADDDVAELVRHAAEESPTGYDAELVRGLNRYAGGSPLLITELLAAVAPSDGRLKRIATCAHPWDPDAAGLPHGVSESIRRRLTRLSGAARLVLEVGAVIGDEFEATQVADVASLPEANCLAALDEALAAGLLRARPGSVRHLTFANGLIRHAVYSDLAMPHRVSLHRTVAERLAKEGGDRLSDVAEHWFAATLLAGSGAQHLARAIDYGEHAGRLAGEEGAFSLAGRHYRHAAQLVEASEPGTRRQCRLLLEAGASYARGDQLREAREAYQRAAEVARRLGDHQLLASAALGYGIDSGNAFYVRGVDETLVGLLEEALAGLEGANGPLRVRVLSRLAIELHLTGFVERREALSRQAIDVARSLADPALELVGLYGWLTATWSPDELPGRLAGSEDVIRRAGEQGDDEMVYRGHDMKLRALLELGDMTAVDREIVQLQQAADVIGKPLFDWQVRSYRAMRALHDGDAAQATRFIREALDAGASVDGDLAQRSVQGQNALRHWLVGDPRELIPILRGGVQSCPWLAVRRARLAFGLAELGRRTEATAEFERLAQDDFAAVPHDGNWLLTMAFLAFTCAALGDVERARALTALLEPYGERFLVSGDATATWGPVSTPLAVLAVAAGALDQAADRFERALEQCQATGADGQTVFAEREYARMLLARGRAGDHRRAAQLLRDATSISTRRGFLGLATRVATVEAALVEVT